MQRWRKGTSGPFEVIRRYSFLVAGVLVLLWPILQVWKNLHRSHHGHTGEICDFDIERIPRCQIYQVIAQDGKVYLLYEAKCLVEYHERASGTSVVCNTMLNLDKERTRSWTVSEARRNHKKRP